jgi:hypothetical protein
LLVFSLILAGKDVRAHVFGIDLWKLSLVWTVGHVQGYDINKHFTNPFSLPPNDVEAANCLDVTAFTGPTIRPVAI